MSHFMVWLTRRYIMGWVLRTYISCVLYGHSKLVLGNTVPNLILVTPPKSPVCDFSLTVLYTTMLLPPESLEKCQLHVNAMLHMEASHSKHKKSFCPHTVFYELNPMYTRFLQSYGLSSTAVQPWHMHGLTLELILNANCAVMYTFNGSHITEICLSPRSIKKGISKTSKKLNYGGHVI